MEISDILIFVLAAIGMVISAISKGAKKRGQAQKSTPNYDEWSMGEGDMSQTNEPILAYEVEDPYELPDKTYWTYDQEAIKKHETSIQIDDMNRENKTHDTDEGAYRIDIDKNQTDTGRQAPYEDFNLRDAILYSELLKPKFKQY